MDVFLIDEDSVPPVSNLSTLRQSGLSLSMASMYSGMLHPVVVVLFLLIVL